MKTKEEIEQLAQNFYNKSTSNFEIYLFHIGFIDGYTQCQEDMQKDVEYWQGEFDHWHQQAMADISKVTRFEVIDEHGRAYTYPYCNVELSYQDDGRTLKVFIKPLKQD
jgi:hypothetical protein